MSCDWVYILIDSKKFKKVLQGMPEPVHTYKVPYSDRKSKAYCYAPDAIYYDTYRETEFELRRADSWFKVAMYMEKDSDVHITNEQKPKLANTPETYEEYLDRMRQEMASKEEKDSADALVYNNVTGNYRRRLW